MNQQHPAWNFDRMALRGTREEAFHIFAPRWWQVGRVIRLAWWIVTRKAVRSTLTLVDGRVRVWLLPGHVWRPESRVRRKG